MAQSTVITTRLLILSDTHGSAWPLPFTPFDVVIHCGDMTEESKISEYTKTLELLKAIPAPLKLVIAGNHAFTLDTPAFERILQSSSLNLREDEDVVQREYGCFGQTERMFVDAIDANIRLLDEGTHDFVLSNGAKLTIYASPFTPSKTASWGFQYIPKDVTISPNSEPDDGHIWAIPSGIDIAITHSPPHGLFDRTHDARRGGSEGLFAAIERARPKLHCFGHIHEGWGAKLIVWRDDMASKDGDQRPGSHLTHIDNDQSVLIESLVTLKPGRFDGQEVIEEKKEKLNELQQSRACQTSCTDTNGEKTLFVNASIQGDNEGGEAFQLPWIVDINLLEATTIGASRSVA